jgi:S1-C subfamily serine protease
VIIKIQVFLIALLLAFSSCQSSKINFNIKTKNFEEPITKHSSIPTDTFLKFETHLFEKGKKSQIISTCSAFSVEKTPKGTIGITNHHCVDRTSSLKLRMFINQKLKIKYMVKTPTNNTYEVKLLRWNKASDLASFLVPDVLLKPVKISKIEPEAGDEVFIIGTPVGFEHFEDKFETVPIIKGNYNGKIKINRLSGTVGYLHTARIAPGSSGSAVFVRRNNSYYVIGVVHSVVALSTSLGAYHDLCISTTLRDLKVFLNT